MKTGFWQSSEAGDEQQNSLSQPFLHQSQTTGVGPQLVLGAQSGSYLQHVSLVVEWVHVCVCFFCLAACAQVWVILENVAKKHTGKVLVEEMSKIGYVCQAVLANSNSFCVPQSRSRLYLAACDPLQADILFPPARWVELLQDKQPAG